jgi:hypothetical protein
MVRTPVNSSNLRSVGYDPTTQTLEVEFLKSGTYQYFGVPFSAYTALMSAPSHGEYFSRHIRNVYSYQKVAS